MFPGDLLIPLEGSFSDRDLDGVLEPTGQVLPKLQVTLWRGALLTLGDGFRELPCNLLTGLGINFLPLAIYRGVLGGPPSVLRRAPGY
jgi:hypothetical protein